MLDLRCIVQQACHVGNLWDQLAARVKRARRAEDRPDVHGTRAIARLDELLPLGDAVEEEIDREIVRAREQGVSWHILGGVLHMTKQGAQHRYRVAVTRRSGMPAPRTMADLDIKPALPTPAAAADHRPEMDPQ